MKILCSHVLLMVCILIQSCLVILEVHQTLECDLLFMQAWVKKDMTKDLSAQ